ncbi:hypothetical protein A6R68_19805, partial [Neotoma lepida]
GDRGSNAGRAEPARARRSTGAEPGAWAQERMRARLCEMPAGRQGALRTHAPLCLSRGAVRRCSIGAAVEQPLARF